MSKDEQDVPFIEKEMISYMQAPITNKTPSYVVSLDQIKTAMTGPEYYRDRTFEYRETKEHGDKKRAAEIKQNAFDYVTFSGKFKYVSNNSLIKHSGLIAIDIDKLGDEEDVDQVKRMLLEDEVIDTTMLFVSPSGNGLKWVISIDVDHDSPHVSNKNYFRAIDEYMKQAYNIEIDQACKDVARACYLPYDPDCILNENPDMLTQDFLDAWMPKEEAPNVFKKSNKTVSGGDEVTPWDDYNENGDVGALLEKHGWSYVGSGEKGDEYLRPGNSTNRYSAIHFLDTNTLYVHSDSTELSVGSNTPAKVFCQLEADGDWSKASRMLKEKGYGKQKTINIVDHSSKKTKGGEDIPSADVYQFWNIDKNGNCSMERLEYLHFLEDELNYAQVNIHGITRIVKIDGHVMHKCEVEDIIQDTRDYIESKIDQPLQNKVAEAFLALLGTITRKILIKFLRRVEFNEQEETHENAFFYYKDKLVEVKADDIIVKDYSDLDGFIWADQRLDREWQGFEDFKDFNYFKFLQNVTGHDKRRWDSMRSVLGYLLHSNKTEGNAKAIVFVDEFEYNSNINASNGGTGKSIVGKSLQHMKKQCYVDGKNFKPGQNNFALSKVEPGDQTLFIDDIKKGFNFENLYVAVTSDMEVERKFENKITIPFEKSPKIVIASNKALKSDDGDSDERRQIMVEFAQHYDANFTPKDEFNGEIFFDKFKWSREDWKKFDSLMIHCLQYYFSIGNEMKQVNVSYELRKLLERIGPEVYEFCEDHVKPDTKYTTEQLYSGDVTDGGKISQGFTRLYDYDVPKGEFATRVKKWAKYKGYKPKSTRLGSKRAWIYLHTSLK